MKTQSKAKIGKGAAVAKLSPLQAKAAKMRAAFTPAMLADILAQKPTAESVVGVVMPGQCTGKIEQLIKDLAREHQREQDARTGLNTLRSIGLKAFDDFRVANAKSAAKLIDTEMDWRLKILQDARNVIASLENRIAEIQGGLVPVMKALPGPSVETPKKPKVESPKDIEWLTVRRSVLEACVQVAAKEDVRTCMNGVHLASNKRELRVAATNGHTLLLHSTPDLPDLPAWLEDGVILPKAELLTALAVMAKLKDSAEEPITTVELGYAKEHAFVILRDAGEQFATFRLRAVDGKFPEYQKVIEQAGAVLAGGEHNPLTATTMDGQYMKQAAAIGAKFEAKGITPFFSSNEMTPLVVTFVGEPGALFVIMPMRSSSEMQMPVQTMALIGRGLEGTLAALKASQTRQKKAMGETKDEAQKKTMSAVIAARDERIAEVMQAIKGKLLPAPKSE